MGKLATQFNQNDFADSSRSVKVCVASNDGEKLQIYRLRYQVYVEEMGRQLASADHKNRLISDELDAWGILVCAKVGTEVIGTVRLNIGTVDIFSQELVRTLLMDRFQAFHNERDDFNLSFASKYIVAPAYRKSQAAYLILAQLYELCRDYQVQFNLAGCNPYMISLYEQVGYRRFAENFTVPEYGCMVPLVWLMEDAAHLRNVRSPFFRNARRRENSPAAANWFQKEFPVASRFINSRVVAEDELWFLLSQKLGQAPERAIPVLAGLSEQEAKKFVHTGAIHMCKKGERMIALGDSSHEMNILLAGRLEVMDAGMNHIAAVSSGGLFGEVALSAVQKQVAHITAAADAEYLIIPGTAFEKFRHQYPVIANKVKRNICEQTMLGERDF